MFLYEFAQGKIAWSTLISRIASAAAQRWGKSYYTLYQILIGKGVLYYDIKNAFADKKLSWYEAWTLGMDILNLCIGLIPQLKIWSTIALIWDCFQVL